MLMSRLVVLFVVFFVLQNSFQIAYGDLNGLQFRNILLARLKDAQESHNKHQQTIVQNLKRFTLQIFEMYNKQMESIREDKIKTIPFRPFFQGRFG